MVSFWHAVNYLPKADFLSSSTYYIMKNKLHTTICHPEHAKIKTSNQSINFTKGSFLFATANIRNTILFATAFKAVSLCFPFSSFCS